MYTGAYPESSQGVLGRPEYHKSQFSPERTSSSPRKELKNGNFFFIKIMSLVVLWFKVKFVATMSATFFDRCKKNGFQREACETEKQEC